MDVFGNVEMVVSTDQARTIGEAFKMISDINIKEIYLTIVTLDGLQHKLTVHDYLLNWMNDDIA